MAKQKKKRNKVYRGADSRLSRPMVTRVEAVQRSRFGQWWFEKKKFAKPVLIGVAIVFVIIFVIVQLIQLLT